MRNILYLLYASSVFASLDFHDPSVKLPQAFLSDAKRSNAHDASGASDFHISLHFLFWEGSQRGLEYALKNTTDSFHEKIQIYQPDFGFHPAFRIGVKTHLNPDQWAVELFYTRYYTSSQNNTKHDFNQNPDGGIYSVWTSANAFSGNQFLARWQDSSSKWKLQTHIVDLFLKHEFCLGSLISIHPGFGLKFAIIQQRYSVRYDHGNSALIAANQNTLQFIRSEVSMKNRSFNLGMGVKIDSKWNLFKHIDLLGRLATSLMATHFEFGKNELDISELGKGSFVKEAHRHNDDYWTIRPMANALFGIGWSYCECRPKNVIYYGINAAYEANIFWKQNMLFRYIDQKGPAMISTNGGNLLFHGLTLEGFIDF